MEAAPPSYETATLVNPWHLVARHLEARDLCTAASVCSSWHAVFTPHLWGNPAAHFGPESDRTRLALTNFQKTLPYARERVRVHTHTLRLDNSHATIYNAPHRDWLVSVLTRLPRLQTLIVRGVPSFDHAALIALRPRTVSSASPSFPLRLLDASRCNNATSPGLLAALERLEHLIYLDLSWTHAAKDRKVIAQLSKLPGLRVLKAKGISLGDDEIEILAKAVSTKVRSLDLRQNKVTDRGVQHLLASCFVASHVNESRPEDEGASSLRQLGPHMLRLYQGHGFEGFLRNQFTTGFACRFAFEDAPESGITHLFISHNMLSTEGIADLLKTSRLHVLDARVDIKVPNRLPTAQGADVIVYPRAEKLALTLSRDAGSSLTWLKLDHEVITRNTIKVGPNSEAGKQDAREGLAPPSPANDSGRTVIVSATCASQPAESSEPETLNSLGDQQESTVSVSLPADRRPPARPSSSLSISGTSMSRQSRSYSSVRAERKSRRLALDRSDYDPSMTPHVQTLTLRSLPSHSSDSTAVDRLITFIFACATEWNLAMQQANLDWSLPPARQSPWHRLEAARRLFALETIVLEVVPSQPAKPRPGWKDGGRSSTDDADSNNLWQEAEGDFSFFDESGEDVLPPLDDMSGAAAPGGMNITGGLPTDSNLASNRGLVDNIARLASFRQEKKAEYDRLRSKYGDTVEVEGYWPGTVRVIRLESERAGMESGEDETGDYYGRG